jgi:hypothetical protein
VNRHAKVVVAGIGVLIGGTPIVSAPAQAANRLTPDVGGSLLDAVIKSLPTGTGRRSTSKRCNSHAWALVAGRSQSPVAAQAAAPPVRSASPA